MISFSICESSARTTYRSGSFACAANSNIYNAFMDWKTNTAYSGGQLAGSEGAICLANLNDTDGDDIQDSGDFLVVNSSKGRNEVDLMKIKISNDKAGETYDANKYPIVISNLSAINVALYKDPTKQGGALTLPYTIPSNAIFPVELYIEAKEHSVGLKDIVYSISKLGFSSTVYGTAVWVENIGMYSQNSSQTPESWGVGSIVKIKMYSRKGYDERFIGQGTCKKGNLYSPDSDKTYGGRMLTKWQIFPNCQQCSSLKERLVFDGTRQRNTKNWSAYYNLCEFIEGDKVTSWPSKIEATNDDHDNIDLGGSNGTDLPNNQLQLFTWDAPSVSRDYMYEDVTSRQNRAFTIDHTNFYEWIRIAIKEDNKYYFSCSTGECSAQGSRASNRQAWHNSYNVRRDKDFLLSKDNESESAAHLLLNDPWDRDINTKFEVTVTSANGPHELNSFWIHISENLSDPTMKDVQLLIKNSSCGYEDDYAIEISKDILEYNISLQGLSFHIKELVGNLDFSIPGQFLNGHTFVSPNKSNSVGENHIGQDR